MKPFFRPSLLVIAVLALSATLAACTVPGEARQGARVLAAYTSQVKAETERFAKARTALARARQRNMNQLEDSAVVTEQANQRELFLWGFEKPAPGPGRQDVYQRLVRASDDARTSLDELAALRKQHEAHVTQAGARAQARTAELAETAKALAQLGEKPDFKGRIGFYLCFFESVHRSIEKAQQAGAAQAAAGVAAADAKNPGVPAPANAPDGTGAGAAEPAPPAAAGGRSGASRSACGE